MKLFSPFRIREIELKNRIVVSPMCEYSAKDGHPQTWHLVHLGSRAIGGAALVFTEASAVEERGRISSADTGIYEDAHVASWRPDCRVYSIARRGTGDAAGACREKGKHGAALDGRQARHSTRWRMGTGCAERAGI